jgi:hypothetical protein
MWHFAEFQSKWHKISSCGFIECGGIDCGIVKVTGPRLTHHDHLAKASALVKLQFKGPRTSHSKPVGIDQFDGHLHDDGPIIVNTHV